MPLETYPVLHDLTNTYDKYLNAHLYLGQSQEGIVYVSDKVRELFADSLQQGTWKLTSELHDSNDIESFDMQQLQEGIASLGPYFNVAMGGVLVNYEMRRNEFRKAYNRILDKCRELKRTDAESSLAQALKDYRDGYKGLEQADLFRDALRLFQKSLERHMQNPIAYLHVGHIFHYRESLRDFNKAWDNYNLCYTSSADDPALHPVGAQGCFYSGWLSAAVFGNLQEAVTWTKRALELDPRLHEANYHLVKFNALIGDMDEASKCLQQTIDTVDPRYCLKFKVDPDFQVVKDDLRVVFFNIAQRNIEELNEALEGDMGQFSDVMKLHAQDKIESSRKLLDANDLNQCMEAIIQIDDVWRKAHKEQVLKEENSEEKQARKQAEEEKHRAEEEAQKKSEEEQRMKDELKARMEEEMQIRIEAEKERLRQRNFLKTVFSGIFFLLVILTVSSFVIFGLNIVGFILLVLASIALLIRSFLA